VLDINSRHYYKLADEWLKHEVAVQPEQASQAKAAMFAAAAETEARNCRARFAGARSVPANTSTVR